MSLLSFIITLQAFIKKYDKLSRKKIARNFSSTTKGKMSILFLSAFIPQWNIKLNIEKRVSKVEKVLFYEKAIC